MSLEKKIIAHGVSEGVRKTLDAARSRNGRTLSKTERGTIEGGAQAIGAAGGMAAGSLVGLPDEGRMIGSEGGRQAGESIADTIDDVIRAVDPNKKN